MTANTKKYIVAAAIVFVVVAAVGYLATHSDQNATEAPSPIASNNAGSQKNAEANRLAVAPHNENDDSKTKPANFPEAPSTHTSTSTKTAVVDAPVNTPSANSGTAKDISHEHNKTSTAKSIKPETAKSLNVICSLQVEWCAAMKNEFEKLTGTTVNMISKSTTDALMQIAAEKENPKLDIWIGGTGDPHLQAAEQDLTISYKSATLSQLHDWARRQAEQSNYRTVGIYAGALGFGYNTELLAKKKLPVPACWKDLLKPEYKEEIQVANPTSSGTAYVAIATLVQLMGEEEAFKYLRALHKNVAQYTRSGISPIKAVARGETAVSISFIHDGMTAGVNGFPVKVATPCEGTGYEIGSMSIIKGTRNLDAAKKWYEWALTPQAQKLGPETKAFQLPSNVASILSPQAPRFSEIKLIDYNFAKYGSSIERKRLIERWDREVGSQPK